MAGLKAFMVGPYFAIMGFESAIAAECYVRIADYVKEVCDRAVRAYSQPVVDVALATELDTFVTELGRKIAEAERDLAAAIALPQHDDAYFRQNCLVYV